jgi:hypothetical protein
VRRESEPTPPEGTLENSPVGELGPELEASIADENAGRLIAAAAALADLRAKRSDQDDQ